ncbi:MAG: hypothetical protein V2J07_05375 [Anaerolineae bacterium]|jgi:heme/copper-type cytochrome/quinol oxidase subunit 2|nr:hypothetical protein [Anaerolineae bacterium]
MNSFPKPEISAEKVKGTPEFKRHRKQSFWQIYFPMLVTLAVFIFVIVLLVLTTIKGDPDGTNSKYADLIVMGIIVIASIVTLIITAVLGASIYYLGIGIKKTPELTNQAKFYVNFGAEKIKTAMDAITKPIIKAGGAAKGIKTVFKQMKNKPTDRHTV